MDVSNEDKIVILREKVKEIHHIRNIQTDDKYLLRFLYSTEFDIDEAFNRLLKYHESLIEIPDWYTKSSPLDKKHFFDLSMCLMLPSCDKEGRPIYLIKMGFFFLTNEHTYSNIFMGSVNVIYVNCPYTSISQLSHEYFENIPSNKMNFLALTELDDIWFEYILTKNPEVAAKGLCIIMDVKGYGWGLLKWMKPQDIVKVVKKFDHIPFKEMCVHMVNSATLINITMKIIWPLIPESSKKMFHFHYDNLNSLYDYIDKSELPIDYGGLKKINYEKINQELYETNDEIGRNFKLYRNVKNSRNKK